MRRYLSVAATSALALVLASPASAHTGAGAIGGLVGGFLHPITGLDHVMAMVAVGMWGAFLGQPAIWLLPVIFPLVMVLGGVLGIIGVPMPAVETGIALSAVVLGLMVAFAARPPLWVAVILVGVFAVFHGYAHGAELPQAADAIAFSIGFVVATGLLHLCGIGIGEATKWKWGKPLVRAVGAGIALGGVGFLTGVL